MFRLKTLTLCVAGLGLLPVAPSQGAETASDPRTHRLCENPGQPQLVKDKVHPRCQMEQEFFAPPNPAPPKNGQLTLVTYNLERGMALDRQIELFKTHPPLNQADVLLLSELDRGCSRTGFKNVARELAQALGMNYAFAVEYVELPRQSNRAVNQITAECEHGNALMSRFPLKNVRQLRHRQARSWYDSKGEPRLGGNVAVVADVAIGPKTLRAYAVHFESDAPHDALRAAQAQEVLDDAKPFTGPVVVAGDMNTMYLVVDLMTGGHKDSTPPVFAKAGYEDAHAALPKNQRGTTNRDYGVRAVIDLIFTRSLTVTQRGVCPAKLCDPLSDHLPVWAQAKWP